MASSSSASSKPPPYISSEGHMLGSQPLSARINRSVDTIYNFFGLYFVSLFSLDPYTTAQNSSFNTRSRGPNHYQNQARWNTGAQGNARASGTTGGSNSSSSGRGGGTGSGGGSGSGGTGRRMGTVDDVRGPECGSCG